MSWEEEEERFKPFSRHLTRRIFAFMRPYRGIFWLTIIVWLLWTAAMLVQPDLLRRGIDRYVTPLIAARDAADRDAAAASSAADEAPAPDAPAGADEPEARPVARAVEEAAPQGTMDMRRATRGLAVIAAIMVGIAVLSLGLRLFRITVGTRLGQRVTNDMRMSIFRHVQSLSMSYFDRTKQGWIIARADSDLDSMEEILAWAAPDLAANILTLAGAVGIMFYYNWRLALAVSLTLPPLFLITYFFRKKVADAYRLVRQATSRITANIAENISGIRVVQSFVRQEKNLQRFDELNQENVAAQVQAARIWQSYWPAIGFIGATGTTVIIWYGTHQVMRGQLTPGQLVAFLGYLGMFFGPITQMGRLYNIMLASMAAAERIFNLLDTSPDVRDRDAAVDLPRIAGSVVFDGVGFSYDRETDGPDVNWILRDVSFEARPGQTVALVGPTGAGKTTIVSLIPRFYDIQEGRILIDGYDVRDVTLQSLHSQMGIVPQDSFLFSGTVMDNIKYGRPDATDAEVYEAARTIGSYDILASLSEGFQTAVGERGASLSQGQRQLVAFTRAIVADPRILILDEATAAVDVQTEKVLQYALEKLIERRTSFVVAHRLSTVRNAGLVLVIEDGRIVERGTHQELLAADGAYTRMYAQFVRA